MEVKRNKPEPVEVPPDTIDITGLTLREAGALRYLAMHGLSWYVQAAGLGDFFRELYGAIDAEEVRLRLRDYDEEI